MGKKNDASLLPSGGEGLKGSPESLVTTPWEDTLEARVADLLHAGEPAVLVTVVLPQGPVCTGLLFSPLVGPGGESVSAR